MPAARMRWQAFASGRRKAPSGGRPAGPRGRVRQGPLSRGRRFPRRFFRLSPGGTRSRPAIPRSSVDFPIPFSPRTPTTPPFGTKRLTGSNTALPSRSTVKDDHSSPSSPPAFRGQSSRRRLLSRRLAPVFLCRAPSACLAPSACRALPAFSRCPPPARGIDIASASAGSVARSPSSSRSRRSREASSSGANSLAMRPFSTSTARSARSMAK